MHQHVASSRSLSRLLVASVLGLALVSLVGLAVGFSVQAQQPDEVDITGIEGQDVSSAATRYSTHPVSSSTSFYETATIFGSATIPLTGSVEISPTVTVCGNGRITVTVWYTPSGSIPVNIEGANPTNANVDVGGISAGYMIFDISGWKTIVYKVNRNVYGSVDVTGSGPVTVTGSGPVGGETGVLVEGETQPEINVFHRNASIPNGTGSVDFGQTPVGIPLTEIFTVSNTGTCTLTLTEPITVPTGFSVPSSFGSTSLTAGDATTFTIRLDAVAVGTYIGTLQFANNDADADPFNFTISGSATTSDVFLPVILSQPSSPPAPLTNLYVKNETSGIVVQYTVHNTPEGDVTCTNIPAGDTEFCGSFTPGTYQVSVDTAQCGASSGQVTFAAGAVTREVRCQ